MTIKPSLEEGPAPLDTFGSSPHHASGNPTPPAASARQVGGKEQLGSGDLLDRRHGLQAACGATGLKETDVIRWVEHHVQMIERMRERATVTCHLSLHERCGSPEMQLWFECEDGDVHRLLLEGSGTTYVAHEWCAFDTIATAATFAALLLDELEADAVRVIRELVGAATCDRNGHQPNDQDRQDSATIADLPDNPVSQTRSTVSLQRTRTARLSLRGSATRRAASGSEPSQST